MSRTIPIALQAHMDGKATTMCGLLQIKPANGPVIGYCSTNRPLTYDAGDGYGAVTYQVMSGFEQSTVVATSDTAVDNSEAKVLALAGGPITEVDINAGTYDGAEFTVMAVNYADLSQGHYVVQHGYVGKTRSLKGAAFTLELRDLVDLLRQVPWEKYQRTCRVRRFGSQPGDERFPCMYDLAPEWVYDVPVTSLGTESTRTFTASSLAQAADYFAPGWLVWKTGQNAGLEFEVESFGLGGVITTVFPMPYVPDVADEFDIRRDCTREWEGHNSCDTYDNRLNFRGEPKMRPADAIATQIPGASSSPGRGGTTFQPQFDEE